MTNRRYSACEVASLVYLRELKLNDQPCQPWAWVTRKFNLFFQPEPGTPERSIDGIRARYYSAKRSKDIIDETNIKFEIFTAFAPLVAAAAKRTALLNPAMNFTFGDELFLPLEAAQAQLGEPSSALVSPHANLLPHFLPSTTAVADHNAVDRLLMCSTALVRAPAHSATYGVADPCSLTKTAVGTPVMAHNGYLVKLSDSIPKLYPILTYPTNEALRSLANTMGARGPFDIAFITNRDDSARVVARGEAECEQSAVRAGSQLLASFAKIKKPEATACPNCNNYQDYWFLERYFRTTLIDVTTIQMLQREKECLTAEVRTMDRIVQFERSRSEALTAENQTLQSTIEGKSRLVAQFTDSQRDLTAFSNQLKTLNSELHLRFEQKHRELLDASRSMHASHAL
ncbi:MAG: hypothetical protein M1814_000913 [Vezdaea aestivalis]|nr:MAG: hypothetical protein M1814_000913 [Vezdaea aestivalis]